MINKVDLNKNFIKENKEIEKFSKDVIEFSTVSEKGLDILYKRIEEMFNLSELESDNSEIITSNRQKQHILLAMEAVEKAQNSLESKMPVDITAICLKDILEELSEITGENASEDIINEIFKKFCLGK